MNKAYGSVESEALSDSRTYCEGFCRLVHVSAVIHCADKLSVNIGLESRRISYRCHTEPLACFYSACRKRNIETAPAVVVYIEFKLVRTVYFQRNLGVALCYYNISDSDTVKARPRLYSKLGASGKCICKYRGLVVYRVISGICPARR